MTNTLTIAIDGPVASGKTAVGRLLAKGLGLRFLDTGSMYRAVTWAALSRGLDLEDEDVLAELAWGLDMAVGGGGLDDRLIVDGQDITDDLTDPKVEGSVSVVARVSGLGRHWWNSSGILPPPAAS